MLAKPLLLAPIALTLGIAAASASTTLPPRKPGLWQSTMTMTMVMSGTTRGGQPTVSELCTDPQVEAMEQQRMSACGGMNFTGGGGTYTMQGTCAGPNGITITTHGTVTMTGDTAAHVEADTSGPQFSSHIVDDAKWVGPCPAGVKPGDRSQMQNGAFVKTGNILDMPKPTQ